MEFLKVLGLGWVASIIGLLGLIGLIVTFFLYRASRVGPRPVYQCQALRLISKEEKALPEELTVLFKDKKVERLTKTYVILWNSGRATVNGNNIVCDDPLRLVFTDDSEVLSARVVRFTRQSNKFRADINTNSANQVIYGFDYLDAGDGATIELLHTDDKRYPEVQGSIRGVPKGVLNWGRIIPSRRQNVPFPFANLRMVVIFGLVSGIFLTALAVLGPILPEPFYVEPGGIRWFFVAFGLFYSSVFVFYLWIRRRRFPKSLSIEDTE
jgi:hypothetical protein